MTASVIPASIQIPLVRVEGQHVERKFTGPSTLRLCSQVRAGQCRGRVKLTRPSPVGLCSQTLSFDRRRHITHAGRIQSASVVCAAALNARCGAEQTQTVTRESSTITIAPVQGKEKSPDLDDGGTGFPPGDDGGGGGGGGGGGNWSGGFFFFGFLAFLGFLKDQESEGPYRENRRR